MAILWPYGLMVNAKQTNKKNWGGKRQKYIGYLEEKNSEEATEAGLDHVVLAHYPEAFITGEVTCTCCIFILYSSYRKTHDTSANMNNVVYSNNN